MLEGNVKSFEEKEVEKIRAQGSGKYHNQKTDKFRCPYCSRPKPRSRLMEHLMEHCQATAINGDDYKIRGQHAALLKVMRSPNM